MTYKKIAEIAGVSLSTVSKALSGNSEISSETAARIRAIAESNGVTRPKYRRARSQLRIAIIVPEIVSVFYSSIVSAVADELGRRGIEPCIYITGFDNKHFCRIFDQLAEDGTADGILLLSGERFSSTPSIPTVRICFEGSFRYDSICTDIQTGIRDALEHLISLGHRDIGFISEKNTDYKLHRFRSTMTAMGLPISEDSIFVSDKRFEMIGVEAAAHFLKQKKLPTAFLTAYDEIATGAIHAFGVAGVKVPEDISIIGINDIPSAQYQSTPLTTVRTCSAEMIEIAAKQLLDQIEHPETHVFQNITLRCQLVIRGTTAAPRKSEPIF